MVTRDELLERLQRIERAIDGLSVRVTNVENNVKELKEEMRSIRVTIFGGNGKPGLVSKVQVVWLVLMYASGLVTAIAAQFASRVL